MTGVRWTVSYQEPVRLDLQILKIRYFLYAKYLTAAPLILRTKPCNIGDGIHFISRESEGWRKMTCLRPEDIAHEIHVSSLFS